MSRPNCLTRLVADAPAPLALPVAVYPGAALVGATVQDIVRDAAVQAAAVQAMRARYQLPVLFTAMDLSVEAEAFGCQISLSPTEVPTVTGRLVTSAEQAAGLRVPEPGDGRTSVPVETVRLLSGMAGRPLVLGSCIGPFSLASRLLGVSEALELTITDPPLVHALVEKAAAFLGAHVQAMKAAGADGVLMAEPAAGLLSPRGLAAYSSAYVRRITADLEDGHFAIVLHNCAARAVHLPAVLEAGPSIFHFGAPMDMGAALDRAGDSVVCGNIDPASILVQGSPELVGTAAATVLAKAAGRRNLVVSSGCDVPADAPLANLDALFDAVARWQAVGRPLENSGLN
jgi:uroporphyrinogen decarboxylase